MDPFSIDAYSPKEIANRIQQLGVIKSKGDPIRVLALSLLAGAFISLGAAFFTLVTHGFYPNSTDGFKTLANFISR